MKKISFILLAILLSVGSVFAQGLELTDKLPNDPNVIIGTLDNGMKYYIRSNATPEKRAEFTLVVHAGSILEDEDQLGLAHFNEHMAFNGSKNFPKHELVNYLESLGMKFGPEVNAYTSFDETVYGIKVPTDSSEYVDKGLLVLYDWASQLSMETEEIDAERGVIHEEWRMGQGAMDRMQRKFFGVLFHNSLYAERLPIGSMDVVDNCDPDVLRRFYNDWYRPDLMAVVVVGDFDGKEMEQKVINQFSQIPKHKNPRERFLADIPDHEETLVCVATDPESPVSMIEIFYKHPTKATVTVADYREDMIAMLLSSMISNRLAELTLQENPPFAQGFAAYTDFIGPKAVFLSIGIVQNNDIQKTMEALVEENQRMNQHGFTSTELEREKANLLKSIEKMYNERDKQKSENYVEEYKANFLPPHSAYPGIEYEHQLFNKYIPEITIEEVNEFASKLIIDKNTVVVVMAPEKEGVKIPSEKEVLEMYKQANKKEVTAYVDKVSDKPLISKMPAKGKVAKTAKNKELDYETWTLKNGVKVVIKTTDFKDDEILFEAKSKGGYSLYEAKDDINAQYAASIANESGLGDFDKAELTKYMSGKNAHLRSYIRETSEGLSGSSSVDDFETLLQMIHVSFTNPKLTQSATTSLINKEKGMMENSMLDPQSAWQDTLQWTMSACHPRRQPTTPDMLDEIDYNRVRYIYKQRFGNPSDFTFYFVGNIDKKAAKKLVEQYLGSLPIVNRPENFKDLGIRPPKGVIEKTVYKGKDPKCVEIIAFHGNMDYTYNNRLELDAVCKMLSTRLLEEIREKESGVYSIGAYPSSTNIPYENYNVSIFFSCDPEREKELVGKTFDIINEIKAEGITEKDIQKVIEKEKREFETSVRENSYWKNLVMEVESGTMTVEDYNTYLENVNNISVQSMKAAANKYFNMDSYLRIKLLPEK
ncbi:MAG: insulinase family protein [Bacteroidales bacterium]|nr:insulinase family protein [Bacteroidales bacterium]